MLDRQAQRSGCIIAEYCHSSSYQARVSSSTVRKLKIEQVKSLRGWIPFAVSQLLRCIRVTGEQSKWPDRSAERLKKDQRVDGHVVEYDWTPASS